MHLKQLFSEKVPKILSFHFMFSGVFVLELHFTPSFWLICRRFHSRNAFSGKVNYAKMQNSKIRYENEVLKSEHILYGIKMKR
jgi:hypothetical protein